MINDCDFKVWNNFDINSWPSIILLTPDGKVIYQKSGEGIIDTFEPFIQALLDHYDKSSLNSVPLKQDLEYNKYENEKFNK